MPATAENLHSLRAAARELKRAIQESIPGDGGPTGTEVVRAARTMRDLLGLPPNPDVVDIPSPVIEGFTFADPSTKRILQTIAVVLHEPARLRYELPMRTEAVRLVDELFCVRSDSAGANAAPPNVPATLPAAVAGLGQQQGNELHPNGPEGGRWLWWKNKRTVVPKGTVYRLLEYMWGRDSAHYDDLISEEVFESEVAPGTIRSFANKANNALPPGFLWRLSADSVSRRLTKEASRNDFQV